MTPSLADTPWRRVGWVRVGRVLLEHGAPMSAGELATALGKNDSNTRRAARAMVGVGLLREQPCQRRQTGPGKTAETEFSLHPSQIEALQSLLLEHPEPGVLRAGQQIVFAAGDALVEMQDALVAAGFEGRGSWAALCDGEPQECMMVLDGPDAVRAAVDLMSMLRAAQVRCRRVGVATVLPAGELAGWSRDVARRARRLRRTQPASER
ncbi:MAG TPA: helix-turn-helix domain-containing protein [Conexibacter sp.]|nr:helix-turn-helix domain-containing protein [Conexibacter sp.]